MILRGLCILTFSLALGLAACAPKKSAERKGDGNTNTPNLTAGAESQNQDSGAEIPEVKTPEQKAFEKLQIEKCMEEGKLVSLSGESCISKSECEADKMMKSDGTKCICNPLAGYKLEGSSCSKERSMKPKAYFYLRPVHEEWKARVEYQNQDLERKERAKNSVEQASMSIYVRTQPNEDEELVDEGLITFVVQLKLNGFDEVVEHKEDDFSARENGKRLSDLIAHEAIQDAQVSCLDKNCEDIAVYVKTVATERENIFVVGEPDKKKGYGYDKSINTEILLTTKREIFDKEKGNDEQLDLVMDSWGL